MTITQSSTRFVAIVAGVAVALSLMVGAFAATTPAQAAALTQSQINAIISLLQSFGADATTVANVTASLNGQATSGSTGGSTSSSCMFSRSLTIGSTGADVTCLQQALIAAGYSIPAGATGYFGVQTQTAVASWQAAKNVAPAAGYFGPISMTAWAATATAPTPTPTPGSDLRGGEATLRSFDLVAGDDLMEGDNNQEIAVAKFDIKGGDVRVQRVTVELTGQSTSASVSKLPWKFLTDLSVYSGGKNVGSIDVGSKSDWDKSGNTYSVNIPVNAIIREGGNAELSIRADAQNNIDSTDRDQIFAVVIPSNGIRAVDAKGIQQYTGKNGDQALLSFDAAQSGDLTLRASSGNPDAGVLVVDSTKTSRDYAVLAFELRNRDAADADLNEITVHVATSSEAVGSPAGDIRSIIRKATLVAGSKSYNGTINSDNTISFKKLDGVTVDGNATSKFSIEVQLFGQNGRYAPTGEGLVFSIGHADITAEGANTGDASDVSGSARGDLQSIALDAGIQVKGISMTGSQTYNDTTVDSSFGTFTLKFSVTADGDDVYIPKTVEALDSGTAPDAHTGVVVLTDLSSSPASGVQTVSLSSTADTYNTDFYVVHEGDTETFTVIVTINPTTAGFYQVGLDKVRFSAISTGFGSIQTLDVDQQQNSLHTDPINISS
jgi:peptidoglycan hydrolase-like protein with peptidoglycan-binding domain